MARRWILSALFLVSACGGPSAGNGVSAGGLAASVKDRTFLSESVEGWQLVPGTEVRIAFKNGELSATAGCNTLDGPYTIKDDTLLMAGIGSTDMGCEPARHAQDDWLQDFLMASPTLALEEPRLIMTTQTAKMTLLDREVKSPDRPLVGTQWTGQGFSDGATASFGPGSSEVSAWFDPSGAVTIFTSCQTGTGTYSVNGAMLTFAGFAYDGAACADANNKTTSDQVQLVLDGSAVGFAIEERSLTIHHGQNALMFLSAN